MLKFLKPKSYPLFDRDKNPKFPDLDFFNHYAAADWKIPTDRNTGFRGPWHDIACQIFGTSARDVARHFIERWNHCKRQIKKHKSESDLPLIMPKTSNSNQRDAIFHLDDDLPTIHAMNGAQGKVNNSGVF